MYQIFPKLPLLLFLFLWVVRPIEGVIVLPSSEPHSEQRIDPVHAPLLPYVGCFPNDSGNSTSLVYLGNGRIITAWHAYRSRKQDRIWLDGRYYDINTKRTKRLKHTTTDGRRIDTDLVVVQLKGEPKMPPIRLADYAPFTGERVVMMGFGSRRKDPAFLMEGGRRVFAGFTTTHDFRDYLDGPTWGENHVRDTNVHIRNDPSVGDAIGFTTEFNYDALPMEAQASSGDSGGAVFVERGNYWHLVGIIQSVAKVSPSTGGTDTTCFGSLSYAIDLSVYREQIIGLPPVMSLTAVPEPSQPLLLLLGLSALLCGRRRTQR